MQDDGAQILEAIYDALDRGDAEAALEIVDHALEAQSEEDPVLLFLGGLALLELDRPGDAVEPLRRAVEMDPEDAEFRANLALALFRCCRFDDAALHASRALGSDAGSPDAHAIRALVVERQGRFEDADAHLAEAARLDPERFPRPVRMDRDAFEAEVVRAGELLPARFRELLAGAAVSVEDVPSEGILLEEAVPLDPELLGLFVGTPLTERSSFGPVGHLPPRILLFKRNLERNARDREDLRREIAITLYHELGHYLGLDEEDLDELDLA